MRKTNSLKIQLIIGLILLLIIGAVGGIVLDVGPFGINPLIARGLCGAATHQLLRGEYQKASELFDLALDVHPKLTTAHFQQMWLHFELRDDPGQVNYHAQRVLAADPDNRSALYYAMYSQYALDNYAEALVYLDRALALPLPVEEDDQIYLYNWAATIHWDLYDAEKAIFYGEQLLELDPDHDDPDLYWILVEAHAVQGNQDKSLAYLDQLAKLTPDDPDIYNHRGDIYAERGDFDRAAEALETAIELGPDDPYNYFKRGELAAQFERWEEALDYYEQALALEPDYFVIYMRQAAAYFNQGDRDAAREALSRYYADDPENADGEVSQTAWAEFLGYMGATDEAVSILIAVLEDDPGDYLAQEALSNIYYYNLETPEALEDIFTTFIDRHPDRPEFLLLRAKYYADWSPDYERAEADYLRYIEAVPDNPEAFISLADYYMYYLDDYQQAIDAFTQAIALDPDNVGDLYCWRAEAYHTLDDLEATLSDLTTGLELGGDDYCRMLRAEIYANELDDPKSAIEDYTILIENEPDIWQLLLVDRGKLYAEIGDYANAEADFLALAESDSDYIRDQGYMWLGWLYHQYLDKPDEALTYYEQATTLADYYPLYLYYRGDLYYTLGKQQQAEDDFRRILEEYPYFLDGEGADFATHPLWAELETGE